MLATCQGGPRSARGRSTLLAPAPARRARRTSGTPGSAPAAVRRAAARASCTAVAPLAGCAAAPAAQPAWTLALSLALVAAVTLIAGFAYALGRLRARRGADAALRDAQAQARELAALHGAGVLWQTDAGHALVSWRCPAGTAATDAALLFTDAALRTRLNARLAFDGQRVALGQPLAGSRGWTLCGVLRQRDDGSFAGFHGSARPTDDADAQQATATAMATVLGTHTGPALLATATVGGWRMQSCNAPAAALWPGLEPGSALRGLEGALPAGARAALDQAMAGAAERAEAEGWAVIPCGGGAAARSLLLLRQPPSAAAGDASGSESDHFSFTVSHDLRAPIRVVEGFTRIVKEDYGKLLDRVGNDHLDRVLGAAARMNLMIDALLTLARLSSQPLARQPVNLSQLAGYVVDDLRRAAPERSVDSEIQPDLTAQGDPTLLRMVLENLLGNAWKYTARAARPQISLRSVPHGAGYAYVVRDNGAGFDMRSAERLFGLFQRLHSASDFPGHGVGLASVRRIVRRHGGDVWAEAEPGKGAAFYFTLAS